MFQDTSIVITDQGYQYLGSAIGQRSFVDQFVKECVESRREEILQLAIFAESQPHAAYAVLTHGFIEKWNFLARTTPGISTY